MPKEQETGRGRNVGKVASCFQCRRSGRSVRFKRVPPCGPTLSLPSAHNTQGVADLSREEVCPANSRVELLAPMSDNPKCQRQRIESALVRQGLELCRERGKPIVLVIGHPGYYPRFGFSAALATNLHGPV